MLDKKEERLFLAILTAEDEDVAETAEEANPVADAQLASRVLAQLGLQPVGAPLPWYRRSRFGKSLRTMAVAGVGAVGLALLVLYGGRALFPREPLAVYHLRMPSEDRLLGPPGPSEPVTRLTSSSTLEIELRPEQDQSGDVRARAFLGRNGELRQWAVELVRSAHGTFRFRAPVRQLPGLATGQYELAIAVGYASSLPDAQRVQQIIRGGDLGPNPGWQLLRQRLEIVDHQ